MTSRDVGLLRHVNIVKIVRKLHKGTFSCVMTDELRIFVWELRCVSCLSCTSCVVLRGYIILAFSRIDSCRSRACLQRFERWQSFCVELERVREERVGFARQQRHSNRGAALCYVIVSRRLEEPVWPVDVLGAQPASPPDPGPTGSSLQGGERESSRPDSGSILGPRTSRGGQECKSRTCLLDLNFGHARTNHHASLQRILQPHWGRKSLMRKEKIHLQRRLR